MKKFGFKKLIPAGISLLTFATFVGCVSGSLAWWAYSTRVSVSYQGTSVSTGEQLQIGLKLDATKFDASKIAELTAMTEDEDLHTADPDHYYVFSKPGSGLAADTIGKYLELEGDYAINELSPITSGSYATGDNLALKESLIAGNPINNEEASKSKYVKIPFVFRIIKITNSVTPVYSPNSKIYLSGVEAEASAANPGASVQKALRVHFHNGTPAQQFILNVGSEETDTSKMYMPVAGALDLNKDGLYDFTNAGEELIYGEYTGIPEHFVEDAPVPEALSDINNVGADAATLSDLDNFTTFLAAHGEGNKYYQDYEGLDIKTAQYKTINIIKPDDSGAILSGTPLCITANDEHCLAELETTIWLEGWDHNVVDSEKNHQFNLGLQFQIDLL